MSGEHWGYGRFWSEKLTDHRPTAAGDADPDFVVPTPHGPHDR